MKKRTILTTGDVAGHCQVSYETVKNWIKAGKLKAFKTPGDHSRILIEDFRQFLQEYDMPPYDESVSDARMILVVDDTEELVRGVTDFFNMMDGYEAGSAFDGYEAGVQVTTFRPDLIILDLIMPHVNGFEVCKKIKSDPATQHIRILAITAHPEDGNLERILACGADDCLEKPFKLEALKDKVEALFEKERKA